MLFLLSLLSTAEAEPLKGLRLNACVSKISHRNHIILLVSIPVGHNPSQYGEVVRTDAMRR